MKIVVIDGQGGKIGKLLVEQLKTLPDVFVTAVGTNSTATAAMLKAGADIGATGENPVKVALRDADAVVGPVGMIIADAMHGEVTPKLAKAVGRCGAVKILIPMNKCDICVAAPELSAGEYIKLAVDRVKAML